VALIGEHDLSIETETVIQERTISRRIRHPNYDNDQLKYDIALHKLDRPVDTQIYTPVKLPFPESDYQGKKVWVTGWGMTQEKGLQSAILQELQISVVDTQVCHEKMVEEAGKFWGAVFPDVQICAGGDKGKDGCQGDSGGPLVYELEDGTFELAGIVSWGIGCAREGLYGVYTYVPAFTPWILDIINGEDRVSLTTESLCCN